MLLFSTIASAGGGNQVLNVKIIKLSTFDDYAIVYFSPVYTFTAEQLCDKNPSTSGDPENPTGPSSKVVIRFENDVNQQMYATLMAAAVSKKTVSLGVVGCDVASGYPKIYRVDVLFLTGTRHSKTYIPNSP
jgi:hypothetical protein